MNILTITIILFLAFLNTPAFPQSANFLLSVSKRSTIDLPQSSNSIGDIYSHSNSNKIYAMTNMACLSGENMEGQQIENKQPEDSAASYGSITTQNWLEGRRIFRDTYNAGKIFIDDFKYVYSSPARINSKSALWLIGITAVGGAIYAFDQEIYDAIKRNEGHKLVKPFVELGDKTERLGFMGFTNRFYFGAIALGYILKYEPLVIIPAEILEGHFIEGAAKNVMNYGGGRHRPYQNDGPYFFKLNDGSSFPSGHAAVVMQFADIITYRVKFLPLSIGVYTVACSICLQRIADDSHWPSDVYIAAVLGWFTSHAVLKRHDKRMASVSLARVGSGVGINYSFRF